MFKKAGCGKVYYSFMTHNSRRGRRSFSVAVALAILFAAVTVQAQRRRPARQRKSAVNVAFASGHSAVIPFDLDGNSVVVNVRVNNSAPMKFFFDTGAAMSAVSTRVAESLRLKKIGDADVKGTGGNVPGSIAGGVSLNVPGVTVSNQRVVVISLDDFPCEVRDIVGFIGYDFIKEFVVEIDYEAKVIKLSDPARYRYQGHGELQALTIKRTPFVHAKIKLAGQEPLDGLFEIDTGSESTLIINTPFVKRHKLRETLSSQIPANGRGVGGESERVGARLESLRLGRFTIPSFVAGLSIETEGALTSTDNDGPIGNEILGRFKITLDYSRRRMWLEPNSHLADGFANDMSGIEFEAGGDDCRAYKITGVAEKSPAAEAGIQPGDEIIAIDDRPAKQFTSAEIYKLLMVDGAEHSLALKRANQNVLVRIKLRQLL
jgi:hypothetical protein